MIIVQTPLRISFFGGGTDFPSYYLSEGGCVLTSSIDKFIYVMIKRRFDNLIRVGYTRTEIVEKVEDLQHELIREALKTVGIQSGVEITTTGDIPAGTGLGSSSAVTVGALHAMYTYCSEIVPIERLAQEACEIEIDRLGKPIGKQDQYISAYGGLRFIEFQTNGEVQCTRLKIDPFIARQFYESFLLFYTGITRMSSNILDEQKRNVSSNRTDLREIKNMAYMARDYLCDGNLNAIGQLLDISWQIKKRLASQISNDQIEDVYQKAMKAGALGGKIAGAGGGGFLLLFCPPEKRENVRSALSGLQELPFRLTTDGTKTIFNYTH